MDPGLVHADPQGDIREDVPKEEKCPMHLAFPDFVRCDSCKEIYKDLPSDGKAPLPGLKQPFPVTALQSNTRLDVLEHQSPDGKLEKYQRIEDEHGKYKFTRSRQQDALELERRKLQLQRERTNKARHEADHAAQDVQWQIADAERSVEEMRCRRDGDMQALEVQERISAMWMENIRALNLRLGKGVCYEPHLDFCPKVASQARLAARAAALAEAEEALVAQEDQMKRNAAEYLQNVQEQCQAQLEALRAQSSETKEAVSQRLPMELRRTAAAQEATEARRNDAHERLQKERQTAGVHTTVMEEDCSCMVRRVELREQATQRRLEEFAEGPVTALERTAQLWHGQSDRKSVCDKVSLEQTAWVLGHHFKSRWNYTPSVDDKVGTTRGFATAADKAADAVHWPGRSPRRLNAKPNRGVGQFVGLKCSLCTWHVSQKDKTKHEDIGVRGAKLSLVLLLRDSLLALRTVQTFLAMKASWRANLAGVAVTPAKLSVLPRYTPSPAPLPEAHCRRLFVHAIRSVPGVISLSQHRLRKLRVELRAKLDSRQASNTVEDSADSAHEQCCGTCGGLDKFDDSVSICLVPVLASIVMCGVGLGTFEEPDRLAAEAQLSVLGALGESKEYNRAIQILEELLRGGQAEEVLLLAFQNASITFYFPFEEMALNMVAALRHVDKAALLLATLAGAGRPEDIGRLMEDMDDDGVPVDVVMHNGMLEALLKTGRVDDAFDWLVSMMAPEDDSSSGSRSREVRPNIWSYTKVAGALARQGRTSAVASLLKTMDQMNVKPAIRLHDRILRGLLSAKKRAEAYRWLRQVVRSGLDFDAQFVTLALDVCIQTGSFTEAFAWLNGMEDAGIDPPAEGRGAVSFFVKAVTVCTMAPPLGRVFRSADARELDLGLVYVEIAILPCPPQNTGKVCTVAAELLSTTLEAKRLKEGLDWLERAEAANLCLGCKSEGMLFAKSTPDEDLEDANCFAREPRAKRVVCIPLRPAYVALMQAFARAQNREQAKDLLVRLEAEEGRVDTMARTTLVEEFASPGPTWGHWGTSQVPFVIGHFEIGSKLSGLFFGHPLNVLCNCTHTCHGTEEVCDLAKKKQWKQELWQNYYSSALQLLHQGSSCTAQVDLVSFNATISSCGKSKLWETSLSVLADIDRECLQKDLFSYNTSFSAIAVVEQWRWSLHLLHDVKARHLRSDIISFNTAIDGCQRKWSLSLAVLAKMSHQNLQPDVIAHDTAISSSEKGNYWDRALDLLRTLEAGDTQADAIGISSAICTCGAGDRWQRALHLLFRLQTSAMTPG
ncbi:PTAC2 [Symbiodinium sp. CCMP2456]|nr:PTAC2 [Symbiodinium sp. CCMP2456]